MTHVRKKGGENYSITQTNFIFQNTKASIKQHQKIFALSTKVQYFSVFFCLFVLFITIPPAPEKIDGI